MTARAATEHVWLQEASAPSLRHEPLTRDLNGRARLHLLRNVMDVTLMSRHPAREDGGVASVASEESEGVGMPRAAGAES